MDDVLDLPEEEVVDDQAEVQSENPTSKPKPKNRGGSHSNSNTRPAIRPRLFVDEETIWKTLTGHGVDFKRVPMLEWKALIGIASTKEAGILQGNLVRLTGQDKRSVPKRTDFLAQKGYIVKRTTMVRGSKTSRLWLSKFAPSLLQKNAPSANRSQIVDMSKEALVNNLDPVPWCDKWNGDIIDYLAFGQTFMALVKAWNVMRFRDLKMKLGILERQWQMRILAKESRRFVAMGVVKYAAAVFNDNRQVFKDCIKYVRDLTDDEWRKFLATGKRSSKYSDQTPNRQPKRVAISAAKDAKHSRDDSPMIARETADEEPVQFNSRISGDLSAWVPEKPLSNTTYETIRRAGRRGISNPRLSAATTGFSFRRYMFTNLTGMTTPDAQPIHLRDFQLTNKLVRSGKTSSYVYFAKDLTISSPALDDTLAENSDRNSVGQPEQASNQDDIYGFPSVSSKVLERGVASLSDLGSVRRKYHRPRPMSLPKVEKDQEIPALETADVSTTQETPSRKPRGRPRKRKLSQVEEAPEPVESQTLATEILPSHQDTSEGLAAHQMSASHAQDITPGVFIGTPGSLNPNHQGKVRGRPKKSLVVIFRSVKIRDLDLSAQHKSAVQSPQEPLLSSVNQDHSMFEDDPATDMLVVVTPENGQPDSPATLEPGTETKATINDEPSSRRGRGRKGAGSQGGKYTCEKCGKAWKNDNGLTYHLAKSQTSCNPDYIQAPPRMVEDKPRKRRRIFTIQTTPEPQQPEATPTSDIPTRSKLSGVSASSPGVKKFARRRPLPATRFHAPRGLQLNADISSDAENFESPQPGMSSNDVLTVGASTIGSSAGEGQSSRNLILSTNDNLLAGTKVSPGIVSNQNHTNSTAQSAKPNNSSNQDLTRNVGQVGELSDNHFGGRAEIDGLDSVSSIRAPTLDSSPRPKQVSSTPAVEVASTPTKASLRQLSNVVVDSPSQLAMDFRPSFEPEKSHLNIDDTRPRFIMPEGQDTTGMSESALRTYQAMEITRYLLDNNDGVFPAEKSLYKAVAKVWKDDIGGDIPPSSYSCGVAVKNLTRTNEIKLETYSARNSQGVFVICQLLTKVDVEHHAAAAVAMREQVLQAHPAPYIPPRFAPSASEAQTEPDSSTMPVKASPVKGPGRRDSKLADEIEVLNAPFYARRGLKGVRAGDNFREKTFSDKGDGRRKRSAYEDEDDSFYVKRQRSDSLLSPSRQDEGQFIHRGMEPLQNYMEVSDDDTVDRLASFGTSELQRGSTDDSPYTQPPKPRNKRPYRRRQHGVGNPGLDSLPSNFFSHTGNAPKQSLNERPEEGDNIDPNLSSWNPLLDNLAENENDDLEIEEPCSPFKESIVLNSIAPTSDVWPDLSVEFFENNSKSFTMKDTVSREQTILKQSLPQSVDDMARRTMVHFKPEEWADPAWGHFFETINGCASYEVSKTGRNRLGMGSTAPDYIFINVSTAESVSNMEPVNPKWHLSRQWTLATLPYHELDKDDDDKKGRKKSKATNSDNIDPQLYHSVEPRIAPSDGLMSPKKKRSYKKRIYLERPEPPRKVREHTAYPTVPQDYVREKNDKQGDIDWAADDTKIAAFVCVGVLLGGLSKNIDWGLIFRLFPEMKVSALRRFWRAMKKEREAFINDLTDKFQGSFVEAYEKKEIPAINFDDVLSYDWPLLVKWTVNLTVQDAVRVPGTRKELEDDFSMQISATEDRDWRESYHHWQRSVFNKFQDATSQAAAVTLDQPLNQSLPDLMGIAKSWIRALCCTPMQNYTSLDIKRKFLGLGGQNETFINELLENAIIELERGKIAIKNKSRALASGRPYRLNDHFLKILDRYAQDEKYALASKFKVQLDETFRQGGSFTIPYLTNDGMIMAIMNLQAHGRVKMSSVDQPDIPFGFEPGNYETRKLSKSYYHWSIEISPTEKYLFDDDIDVLAVAKQSVLPREQHDGKLPLWCDFFGVLDTERWSKILGSVLFMLATRGSMDADAASLALQPCIEVFEVEAIMSWAKGIGLLQEMTPGGGLTVCEWWWLVVGRQIDREGDGVEEMEKGVVDEA